MMRILRCKIIFALALFGIVSSKAYAGGELVNDRNWAEGIDNEEIEDNDQNLEVFQADVVISNEKSLRNWLKFPDMSKKLAIKVEYKTEFLSELLFSWNTDLYKNNLVSIELNCCDVNKKQYNDLLENLGNCPSLLSLSLP